MGHNWVGMGLAFSFHTCHLAGVTDMADVKSWLHKPCMGSGLEWDGMEWNGKI